MHIVHTPVIQAQYQFQLAKSSISNTCSVMITCQQSHFVQGINHGCSKNLMNLNQWIQRYTSILWYRLVGLDQNSFFDLSKCYSLENDFNGIVIKFALENIFNEKYAYLGLFISRINVVIGQKLHKASKRQVGKTFYFQEKYCHEIKVKK